MSTLKKIVLSWQKIKGCIHTIEEILDWVNTLNRTTHVKITKTSLNKNGFWYMDQEKGIICNQNNSFFSIHGCVLENNGQVVMEQPIILQEEIGYLGIITKEIEGTLYFLMQAKIEPGNLNKIQISPTIQATKSNFTQQHGGNKPVYLEYFLEAECHEIIVDQIQSEQSSRFYKKRNRNIIINVTDDIELGPNFKWMTLGQLKKLMDIDNLVNMDTRTVISCIPFSVEALSFEERDEISKCFQSQAFFNSIFVKNSKNHLPQIYRKINNYKMFSEQVVKIVPLDYLRNWSMKNNEFICAVAYPFKVIFCDIEIEGREVKKWIQPLFEAIGMATFGLLIAEIEDRWQFLVKLTPEIGCMDMIELGPTVQLESTETFDYDPILRLFKQKWDDKEHVLHDVILSEEGGRFYHEQNRNIIIKIDSCEIEEMPNEYMWVDFYTLNHLVQINNCLNIQLRNLLSLLKVNYESN